MRDTNVDRLTLGYLVDFSLPFMSNLILGLMRHHDRGRFGIVIYAMSPANQVPQELRDWADLKVVSLAAMDEFSAAELIRAGHVDVLIDASGFGTYAKPGLLSYRPATVQIALPGLDRPGAMGGIDGRLSDQVLDFAMDADAVPPAPWRVNGCVMPVLPAAMTAPFSSRAALGIQDGAPVFGVLASVGHLSLRCAGLWKQLSTRVPDAVFLVRPVDDVDIVPIQKTLINAGIDAARLFSMSSPVLRDAESTMSGLVDIILDTFPASDYIGVRTSILEGIPMMTMSGGMPAERVGTTILTHLGLTEGIAQSGRDYLDIAAGWAANPAARMSHSARARKAWQDATQTGAPFSMGSYTARIEAAVIEATALHANSDHVGTGK